MSGVLIAGYHRAHRSRKTGTPVRTSREWLIAFSDKELNRNQVKLETTKVVAIFATGIAASLASLSLEATGEARAVVALAVCVALTLFVVAADRLTVGEKHEEILATASVGNWTDDQIVREFEENMVAAMYFNRRVVRTVMILLALQLVTAALTGAVAVQILL